MDRAVLIYDAWLLALTGVAAFTDARNGTIPNWLTLPSLALAPLAHTLSGGPGALVGSLAGAAVCALVPLLLFRRGAMGGGDVKLFAGAGALAGASTGLALQLLTYVLAGLAAACWLAYTGRFGAALRRTSALAARGLRARSQRNAGPTEAQTSVRLGAAALTAYLLLMMQRVVEAGP